MARKNANKHGRGRNLWWITGAVVAIVMMCAAATAVWRFYFPAQPTPLPPVPTFAFTPSIPTAGLPGIATVTPQIVINASPTGPTSTATVTPTRLSTPTNSSLLSRIFSGFPQFTGSTVTPSRSSTPIQVVLTTPSATATSTQTSPPPPPPPATSASPGTLACNNVLYPARPGNQWVYRVTTPGSAGDVRLQIAAVEGTQAIVDVTDLSDGSTGRGFAQCDGDVILNFPLLGVQNIINNIVNGTMYMDYWGGVLAPNESALSNSNWALSWVIFYQVYGSGSLDYNGRNFDFTMSPSVVAMQCQTLATGDAAFENISVSAGSFRALKVVCRGEGEVNANVNGSQVSGSIFAQATQWFAPRIGLLRLQSDFVVLNVFGLSIPLNSPDHAGSLELRSYQVGP